jgi:Fe(3+) dicitrate transport protein
LGSDLAAAGGNGTADQFNGGEVDVMGLELLVAYDFVQSQQAKFRIPLTLVYTYTDAKFKNDFDSQFGPWGEVKKGDNLPYISNHQLALGISFEHEKFSLNFTSKYSDKMRTQAGQGEIPSDQSTDNNFIGDISVHYKLNARFRIIGDIKNITDQVYSVSRRPAGLRPGLPRSFSIGLNASF